MTHSTPGIRGSSPHPLPRCRACLVALLLLAGCATNLALDEGRRLIGEDRIEEGLRHLEQASAKDPRNAELRTFHARQRELAVARLLAQADIARSAGSAADAELALKRVIAIDPKNTRAANGFAQLQADRRHAELLREGEALLAKGDVGAAETRVRTVLAENAGFRPALALQRRIAERRGAALAVAPPALGAAFAKEISIELRDAALRAVFEIIARQHGVNFVFDRDVRPDVRVTIFVRNAPLEDIVNLILATNQLEKKVLGPTSLLIYPNTPAKVREYKDLAVRSFYLGNADAKQTLNMIRTMLKTRDVFIDEKLNLLVMRDTPEAIRVAEKLIRAQDLADPEVMLEIEVLEVSRARLSELGIRFPDRINFGPLGAAGAAAPASFAYSSGQLTATIANPAFIANLKLQDSQTNVLANPRIRVRNRDKARVHVGERVPVVTTTSTANVGVSASVNYLEVGLKLDVEPNVHLDDEVAIKIGLEVSNIIETIDLLNTRAYRLGTRNAATTLRLRDGETQVLAGLVNDDDRKSANKVPGLGELPIVGRIFGTESVTDSKSEIVLLVTPRIIRNVVRPDTLVVEFLAGTEAAAGSAPLQVRAREGALALSSSGPAGSAAPSPILARDPIPAPAVIPSGPAGGPLAPKPQAGAPPSLGSAASPTAGTPAAGATATAQSPTGALFGGVPVPALPLQTSNLVWVAPSQVARGAVFTIDAGVQAGTLARSAQIDLTFDPTHLQPLGVSSSSSSTAGSTVSVASSQSGRLSLSMQTPASGQQIGPATVQFRVITGGAASTTVTAAPTLRDAAGVAVPGVTPLSHTLSFVP